MKQTIPSAKFAGFVTPEKNYFHMPNEWIDICAEIDNLAEIKVIQYVLRHTWGFQEYGIAKAITVEEFMNGRKRTDGTRMDNGTGLKSDRSVKDGIKAAIEHGYLTSEVDDTDKARIKKAYALTMASTLEGYNLPPDTRGVVSTPLTDETRGVVSTPLSGSIYPSGVQNLPLYRVVSTPRTEKDTIERHYRKTLEKEREEVANATAPIHPILESDPEKTEERIKSVKPHDHNRNMEPPAPTKPKLNVVTPKRPKQETITMPISPEAQRILDDWASLFTKKVVVHQGDITAAERLVPTCITREEMKDERLWLFSTDDPKRPWYRKLGVCLADIDKKRTQWLSVQEAPPRGNGHTPVTTGGVNYNEIIFGKAVAT